jgi:hypothetical protein
MFAKIFKAPTLTSRFDDDFLLATDRIVSYEYTKRWTKTGDFTLVFPFDREILQALRLNGTIYLDGDWLFIQNVSYNGKQITVTGKDCKAFLETRIAIPDNTGYTGYTSVSGTTAYCIEQYLNQNCINPTDTNRKLPLVFEGGATGLLSDSYMARFEYLSDIVTAMCENADIGYDIRGYIASRGFKFYTLKGVDRSFEQDVNPRVIFSSSWRNVLSQSFEHGVENVFTAVYGTDNGNYSKLVERNPDYPQQALDMSNPSDIAKIVKGIARRECNVTVGISNSDSWFEKYALNEVKDNIGTESFDIIVPFSNYGTDYSLGDTVTIKDDFLNNRFNRVITEVTKSYHQGQRSISLVLGIPKQKPVQKIINNLLNKTQRKK